MRFVIRLALVLSVGVPATFARAQSVGDRIVVTTPNAPLRSRNETTGSVPTGTVLVVKHVQEDWFWVVHYSRQGISKGWINRADVVLRSQAVDVFSNQLRSNPTAASYALRGKILCETGDFDRSIADCAHAICLDPTLAEPYDIRARASMKKGDVDRAIADWSEAIRRDPKNASALDGRARAWMAKAEADIALAASIGNSPSAQSATVEAHDFASHIALVGGDSDSGSLGSPAVLDRSHPNGPLDLRNVAFCHAIENYGRWTRFKRDEFAPGKSVLLYAEVENFISARTRAGSWRVVLESTIKIYGGHGELVQEMPFAPNEDLCNSVRRDYYNSYEFNIPTDCAPGPHQLKLTIKDLLSRQTATCTADFIVKKD
jgi:tetratricopeptide (TPR) repeat protein